MKLLYIEPNDTELFQSFFDEEKQLFLLTHFQKFEQMYTEQGTVFWLRFVVTFERNYQISKRTKGEFEFLSDKRGEQLLSCMFTFIHDHFVISPFSEMKKLLQSILVASKYFLGSKCSDLTVNPFCTFESREAFGTIIGKLDMDEEIPFQVTAFLCLVCFEFSSGLCVLLKRWLKEPDLGEKEKNQIDDTVFYWKPFESWKRDPGGPSCLWSFNATCFEQYLAEYWGESKLSEMLLHSDVYNLFSEHIGMLECCELNFFGEAMNAFQLHTLYPEECDEGSNFNTVNPSTISKFSDLPCTKHKHCYMKIIHSKECFEPNLCEGNEPCKTICPFNEKNTELEEPVVQEQRIVEDVELINPPSTIIQCVNHDFCYLKVLHAKQCQEPYICNGANPCKVFCKLKLDNKRSEFKRQIKSFWKTVEIEIHSCKKGKRNVATLAQSNDIFTETYFPCPYELAERHMKPRDPNTIDEFSQNFLDEPDVLNNLFQFRKKEQVKARLRKKLCKKNPFNSKDFEDKTYCNNLYQKAMKTWQNQLCNENFQKILNVANSKNTVNEEGSLFGNTISIAKAKTSIAVGTNDIVYGRAMVSRRIIPPVELSFETNVTESAKSKVETKSKKEKKKRKTNSKNEGTEKYFDNFVNVQSTYYKKQEETTLVLNSLKNLSAEIVSSSAIPVKQGTSDNVGQTKAGREKIKLSPVKNNIYKSTNNEKMIVSVSDEPDTVKTFIPDSSPEKDKVEEFLSLIGVLNKPSVPQNDIHSTSDKTASIAVVEKKLKLKTCAFCGGKEIEYRTFKRCSKCKLDKFAEQRYYCSRECQVDDWEESHREEHQRKTC